MNRPELEARWNKVRAHLEAAATRLPDPPKEGDEGGTIEAFREWLDHNELGLALDELTMLGEANEVPSEYWLELASAAGLMGLDSEADDCRARLRRPVR